MDPVSPLPGRLERWIEILEDLVRIPFTRITFGLDVVLGLLPVIGDFAGLLCGIPLVAAAIKRRLPFRVVLVMLANVLVDAVFGSVPVLGNLFDLLWKAHRKNLELLKHPDALADVLREARGKLAALVAIVSILAIALVFLLAAFFWLYIRLLSASSFSGL
jgi:hypothetical protein